jgi:acyl-CoA synthetase (NDP forming)
VDSICARAIIAGAAAQGRDQLTQLEALALLKAYRIPVAEAHLARTVDDAVRAAADGGYPIVLKVVSADIIHKTDAGGVRTGIASEQELRRAYDEILTSVRAAVPAARVDGIMVQRMMRGACETIVGVTRDASFGPLVMFGLGGIFVEALRDVIFRIAPVDDGEAMRMVTGLRGAKFFDGLRGAPPVDREALVSVIRRIGQLAIDCPEILELDVNPLLALEHGAVALDARVRIAAASAHDGA